MTVSGQFSCPPPGSFVAVSGQFLVAAVTLWLWAKILRADLVAAARRYARNAPGTVLVTCRIPRARALISHFGDWHCVLNGQPVLPWSLSDEVFGSALDQWYAHVGERVPPDRRQRPRSDWPADLLTELETSWLQIFDLAAYPRRSYWQACVAEIVASEVVDAVQLGMAQCGIRNGTRFASHDGGRSRSQ